MAERELRAIADEARRRVSAWTGIVVRHRLGELAFGDVERGHRRLARAPRSGATTRRRYVIEELKKRVPIWKCEHYADGSRAWVDPRPQDVTPEPCR